MSEYTCWCGEALRLEYGERFIDIKVTKATSSQVRRAYVWWRCASKHVTSAKEITPS